MTASPRMALAPISVRRQADIRQLWDIRRCFICEHFGPCPHREINVELALFDAAASRSARRSQSPLTDPKAKPWTPSDSMSKELFQVAATRGREHIEIITGNKEVLKESIAISAQRQSVTELVRKIQDRLASHRKVGMEAPRPEALSSPAHAVVHELENRNQGNVNVGQNQPLYERHQT